MTKKGRYLFDTCLMLYLSRSEPISLLASNVLDAPRAEAGDFFVSGFSAWEVSLLVSKGRLSLTRVPLDWFREFGKERGVQVIEATHEILVASSYLPEPLHNDPADRILIATAREHDLTIITRDRAILAYGTAGHVKTLAC
ncbi:MAG: twitching motility protein PilT [Rhizobium sp.]|nr:twitching motility protein PilT [Rhizobium sp.]